MLYLLQAVDPADGAHCEQVPVAELTAVGFERALLTLDREARERELATALARDPAVSAWAVRAAQLKSNPAATTTEDAIGWLSRCLETELAMSLKTFQEHSGAAATGVETRLPALAIRLAEYERRVAHFNERLEHEKLEAMKELAYGASHEINNPLANIAVRAQTLLKEERDPERGRKLAAIHRQAMRAHEMIADLMLFARPPKLNLRPCDAQEIVQQVAEELAAIAAEQDTELTCEVGEQPIELEADATQLAVAIHALATNALEATAEGGHVRIIARSTRIAEDEMVEISVCDDGPGISDSVRQRIFDPFFSGREAGRGLGFGLSKCWRIITDHGGRIVVDRPAAGGAQITIVLKVAGTLRMP